MFSFAVVVLCGSCFLVQSINYLTYLLTLQRTQPWLHKLDCADDDMLVVFLSR